MEEITVKQLKEKLSSENTVFILDVREPFEYQLANLEGTLIPLGELPNRIEELEDVKNNEIVVMCRSGNRSAQAISILEKEGFKNVKNLKGGINAWAKQIDSSMPVY